MLKLDANRQVVQPKDAATVVVMRQVARASEALEIFCVKRHAQSGFLGGALVFPGGKLAPADSDASWAAHSTPLSERCLWLAADERHARGLAIAGLRELLEEAAILATAADSLDDTA